MMNFRRPYGDVMRAAYILDAPGPRPPDMRSLPFVSAQPAVVRPRRGIDAGVLPRGARREHLVSGFVDAHHHLWDPSAVRYTLFDAHPQLAPLVALGATAAYDAMAAANGISAAVCVEVASSGAPGEAETAWLTQEAEASHLPRSLVAWAPVEHEAIASWLDHLGSLPVRVAGVRRSLERAPDGFALRNEVIKGIAAVGDRGLVFDLVLFSRRLPEVTELVRRLPSVTFVLDHLGKPALEPSALAAWRTHIEAIARLPNVVAKLSGLLTERTATLHPDAAVGEMIAVAIDRFGPARLMLGTDWPVCQLVDGGVARWLALVTTAISGLDGSERAALLGGTAARIYRLPWAQADGSTVPPA